MQLFDAKFVQAAETTTSNELMLPIGDIRNFLRACGEDASAHAILVLRYAGFGPLSLLSLDMLVGLVRMKRACEVLEPTIGARKSRISRTSGYSAVEPPGGADGAAQPSQPLPRKGKKEKKGKKGAATLTRSGSHNSTTIRETGEALKEAMRLGRPKRVVHFEKRLEGHTCAP